MKTPTTQGTQYAVRVMLFKGFQKGSRLIFIPAVIMNHLPAYLLDQALHVVMCPCKSGIHLTIADVPTLLSPLSTNEDMTPVIPLLTAVGNAAF